MKLPWKKEIDFNFFKYIKHRTKSNLKIIHYKFKTTPTKYYIDNPSWYLPEDVEIIRKIIFNHKYRRYKIM